MTTSPSACAAPLRVIGIDPGLDGALVTFDSPGGVEAFKMPTLETRKGGNREIDTVALLALLNRLHAPALIDGRRVVAYLEKVGGRYEDGASRAFNFGDGYGQVKMGLVAAGIPHRFVTPLIWKRSFGLTASKDGAVQLAGQIFPQHAHLFRGPRGGKIDGVAEALLISVYGLKQDAAG